MKKQDNDILIVSLYVDDLIITDNNENMILTFKSDMMRRYEMNDIDLLHYFLGIKIKSREDGIFICQKKYVKSILKKFKMENCNVVATPLVVNEKFMKENEVVKPIHHYIEALLEAYFISQLQDRT